MFVIMGLLEDWMIVFHWLNPSFFAGIAPFGLLFAEISSSWFRWDVALFGSLFVIFVSLGSYGLGMNIRDKRKKELEKLVKERTEELERANQELKQRNSELDRFVYSASHDLSSPLKSILGLINVARIDHPDVRQLQYLDMMERSVHKLETFIEEVIRYSRNARMPLQTDTFDFKKFVSEILIDYQYAPNFDKIKIDIEDDTNEPITTDGMRLKIILNNLISNAIKFHWFDNHKAPMIRISRGMNLDSNLIVVEDNGKGIQSEYVEKIFEMFFRGTEETQGSGLGLYILKETVNRLSGKVEVKSGVDEGTTFIVVLPLEIKVTQMS